jgi:hypothetical protein
MRPIRVGSPPPQGEEWAEIPFVGGGPLDGRVARVGWCDRCGNHAVSDGSSITHVVEGWRYELLDGRMVYQGVPGAESH